MIRVGDSRELQATVLALKAMDRELRNDINRSTRATIGPVWKSVVAVNATTAQDTRILAKGAQVRGGNPPTAVAATSNRRLSGGLVPSQSWPAFEFGGDQRKKTTYSRKSKKGGTHRVTRRTQAQLPRRARTGRAIYPSIAEVGPRLISLWVQLVVKKTYDAFERGQ